MSFSFENKSENELIQLITTAFYNCSLPDPTKRKQGEQTLLSSSLNPSYPLILTQLILTQNKFDISLRSSIELKKWCEKYDKLSEYDTACLQNVVENLKIKIIEALFSMNYKISLQISEAVYLLSKKEFPDRWRVLARTLASALKGDPNNFEGELIALKTMLKIFKKYEYSERSDPLYEEIILVCDETHDIFLMYVQNLLAKIYNSQDPNPNNLMSLKLLKNCLKIFYCLNFQDLHPNFENNLNLWMNLLAQVLKIEKALADDVLLFKCKGEAMRSILLYATKYREEFEGLINNFSQEIWNICAAANEDNKYDKLILNALKYFKSLILWPSLKSLFSDNLSMLITSLIIPNLKVSKKDQIIFKEEPENFIDIYFNNNGELSSRRSVTVELMKSLAKYYKEGVNQILQSSSLQYAESLQKSAKNLDTEITLINLFCDGASVCFRARDGVTEIAVPVEMIHFIFNNLISGYFFEIYQDIANKKITFVEDKYNALHLSYLLRFVFYFRIYLEKSTLMELARMISFFLNSKNDTLISVVYYTIEAIIDLKEGDFKMLTYMKNYFNKDNIQPQIQHILQNIYTFGQDKDLNNYLLKVMLTIIKVLAESNASYIGPFASFYQIQLDKMIKGYTFQNSFLIFESLGNLVFYSCNSNPNSIEMIENYIVPHLNNVFNKNLSDLLSFVLQIYALIVQSSPTNLLKETYSMIYSSILDTKNWIADNSSIFPAYCLYLESYLKKFPQKTLETAENLKQILLYLLGNQQELLFFNICRVIIGLFDWNSFLTSGWFSFIFQTTFSFYSQIKSQIISNDPLQNAPQQKNEVARPVFIKEAFNFICEVLIKYDPKAFVANCDQSTNGMLKVFLQNEINVLKTAQRRGRERKIIFVGMSNLMFYALDVIGIDIWSLILLEIVQNISNRRNIRARIRFDFNENHPLHENIILGNNSGFQKLSCITENKIDVSALCKDEEKYFALKFNEFYSNPQIKNAIDVGKILSVPQQCVLTINSQITQLFTSFSLFRSNDITCDSFETNIFMNVQKRQEKHTKSASSNQESLLQQYENVSKKASANDNIDKSFYLEDFHANYLKTNAINPKFYNLNLIELVRKHEAKTNKNSDFLQRFNSIGQKNLLEDDEKQENQQQINFPKVFFKENHEEIIKQTKHNNNNKNNIETTHVVKNKDSEGNKTINQYTILKTLGSGNFGKVKLAFCEGTKKHYAIKVANKKLLKRKLVSKNSNSFSLLEKEIAIMKKLNHPNIIKLFEVIDDRENEKLFLVMEYMKKGAIFSSSFWEEELKTKPVKKPPDILSESKSRKYFRQLLSALNYLHNHVKVIHRDIKPENILISEDDNVKLADFGVSFLINNEGTDQISNTVGTKAYLSPEAWENNQYEGFLSDIYACGVTLYYFFHGKVPFFDLNLVKLKAKIKNDPVIFGNGIPDGVKDVINLCLEKDPKKRINLHELLQHNWVTNHGKEPVELFADGEKFSITKDDLQLALTRCLGFKTTLFIKMKMMRIRNKIRLKLSQKAKNN